MFPTAFLRAIQMAGAGGISRRELGDLFDLDAQLLNQLLVAYASLGFVTVTRTNGIAVLRATW